MSSSILLCADNSSVAREISNVVVVTAVDEFRTDFLTDLADSLMGQSISFDCDVVWSIRFDGDSSVNVADRWRERLSSALEDSCVSHVVVGANGVRRGTATTRTMALYAALECDWVVSVDADDLVAPGGLDALLKGAVDAGSTGAGFVSGKSIRFGVDEDGVPWSALRPDVFGSGLLPRGAIVEQARLGELAPVTPNTILYDAKLVEAFGGWPAVVSAEDLGLLYPVSEVVDGWRIDDVVLLRRRWEGQVTSGGDNWHEVEHDLFVEAALRRAKHANSLFSHHKNTG